MTVQEINSAIIRGGFTNDSLNSIAMAIKFARNQLAKVKANNFKAGQKVEFVNSKTGRTIVGEVIKVNRKFVLVREDRGVYMPMTWRVPACMLEHYKV